jgi:hypothetical protein
MRPIALLAAALAALLLGACGGSASTTVSSAPATATVSSTASAPATSSTAASTPATTTATTSHPSSATPLCTAATLGLTYLGGQGATGHGELGFALRNTGTVSCHTYGYPGVLFLTAAGQPLPTASTRSTHDFFGNAPEVALTLAPGSGASFRLGVTHGINSSAGCTTAGALQVIAPDDTATLRVTIPQGAYECGTATVSPLRPGNSAYP